MKTLTSYIAGRWIDSSDRREIADVINPATEEVVAQVCFGDSAEVDTAVRAARGAFEIYGRTSLDERIALLRRVIEVFQRRYGEMVRAISTEMGAPHDLSKESQAECGPGQNRSPCQR